MKLIKYFLVMAVCGLSLMAVSPTLAYSSANEKDATLKGLTQTAEKVPLYQKDVQDNSTIRTMLLNRVGGIVGLILSFVGVIFLILTIYAGIMWMTAQGNSAQVEKAKDLLINALIGLVIITAAYSITTFVGQNLTK